MSKVLSKLLEENRSQGRFPPGKDFYNLISAAVPVFVKQFHLQSN